MEAGGARTVRAGGLYLRLHVEWAALVSRGAQGGFRGPPTFDAMSDPLSPLPLALVVITRDASTQLADCLTTGAFAAEKLVVDSGSHDNTVEIARRCGARVIEQPWLGFGAQKNFAVGQATHDWVLCLDADERVSAELAASIRAALAHPEHSAYMMARRNCFLGRWLRHGEGYPDWNLRLFDRRRARW